MVTQEDRLKLLKDRTLQFKCRNLFLKNVDGKEIKVEPYDLSENGIIVIVYSGVMQKTVEVKGRGSVEAHVLSEVLFKDILAVQKSYPHPTLICRFYNGNPFHRDVYYDVETGNPLGDEMIAKTVAEGGCGTWILYDNGELHIRGSREVNEPSWAEYKNQITSVIIEPGIKSIPDFAFKGCNKLCSVSLGNIETIGQSAFEGCTDLTAITIPESIDNIKNYAFKDCTSLKQVAFLGPFPFENCLIFFPPGSDKYTIGQDSGYIPFDGIQELDAYYDSKEGCSGKEYNLFNYTFTDNQNRWAEVIRYNWGAGKINWNENNPLADNLRH